MRAIIPHCGNGSDALDTTMAGRAVYCVPPFDWEF